MMSIVFRKKAAFMKRRICLVVEDSGYSEMCFNNPELGNPGVSGTVYEFLMLIKYLSPLSLGDICVYHFGDNIYPDGCVDKIIENHNDIFRDISSITDVLIVQSKLSKDFYKELEGKNIKTILWAHNYLSADEVELFYKMKSIKRIVFVGREQYDHYIGHDIIFKSEFIYNMYNCIDHSFRDACDKHIVTYTGCIIPAKGFHLIARIWKDIINDVPDAQLFVLGNGKLYDNRNELGQYGIAEEEYEKSFISYITDDKGKLLDSVHFLGVLGSSKDDIYKQTRVGVMNPSGISETFGLSGVEMAARKIPVVTKKKYGLLDIVRDGETGYLVKNETQLKKAIVKLLKDNELNNKMGENGYRFVKDKFQPEKIIKKWEKLILDVFNGKDAELVNPTANYFNDRKWIMIANRKIRNTFPKFPSFIGLKARISRANKRGE